MGTAILILYGHIGTNAHRARSRFANPEKSQDERLSSGLPPLPSNRPAPFKDRPIWIPSNRRRRCRSVRTSSSPAQFSSSERQKKETTHFKMETFDPRLSSGSELKEAAIGPGGGAPCAEILQNPKEEKRRRTVGKLQSGHGERERERREAKRRRWN